MHSKLWKWFNGKISIRKKLIISFSILVLIPLVTLGVYSFHVSKQNLKEQTDKTMDNNLSRLMVEMKARFQRENDVIKYLAYNLEFRESLESRQNNNIALAKIMNKSVEPTLWYFITSDSNIKNIKIVTPYLDKSVGSFLEPSAGYHDKSWYQEHQHNFNTVWTVEEGRIFATRTILDTATTSRPIAVMRVEFYGKQLLEPITTMNYLENGILLLDRNGAVIYEKKIAEEEVSNHILDAIGTLTAGEERETKDFILKSGLIGSADWSLYYFINKDMIAKQMNTIIRSTLFMVLLCIAVIFVVIGILSGTLSKRILLLKEHAERIANGNMDYSCATEDTDEIGIVTNSLGKMTLRLNDMINQVYKMEIDKKAVELKALQAMINPHFLYNCLSSIKWKALKKGEDEIGDIAGLVAKFYRTSLNNGEQITTVGSELDNIASYVEIQQLTHDNSFDVEYRINTEHKEDYMLNFLLQPIVENAIKHGIDYKEDREERGLVRIEYLVEDDYLVFHIYNNGPKVNVEDLKKVLETPGKGYGIFNTQERIDLYYGDSKSGISSSITKEGLTCFTVRISKTVKDI